MPDLSLPEARRLALSSLGFGAPRPAKPGLAHVRGVAQRLNAIQIDSVNVLVRAHHMPAFSRLGPYPVATLDTLAYKRRELFEYWGHAACLLPTALYPLLRFRMDVRHSGRHWGVSTPAMRRFIEAVLEQVKARGPLTAAEIEGGGKATGSWWGWSEGKRAVEILFHQGRVAVSGRRNFERLYDLPERVFPPHVLSAVVPSPDDSKKQLLVLAAKAHGIGTARDLAGYFHIEGWYDRSRTDGRLRSELPRLMAELVEEQRLQPVRVDGWQEQAYTLPQAKIPKQLHASALVSPFDPLLWERAPAQRLFGFDYKIEIYVPAPKRIYGYYVLPFLLGDRFAARVDLKADRQSSTLLIPGAFLEDGLSPSYVAAELAQELRSLAHWLNLDRIAVGDKGNLAQVLRKHLRQP